jgi:hypothetical protein
LRRRRDRGAADALEHAGADERQPARGEAREDRSDREDDQAQEEEAPASGHVAEAPEADEQRGEDERVDRHDPLRGRAVELQVPDDARDRDVHDRRVDDDHREPQAQHQQAQPAAPAGRGRFGERGSSSA